MDELQDMVSSEFLKPFFIEHISKYCDKCGMEYKQQDIGIISETNSSAIIQAQCHKCKSSYMAHIVKPLQMTKKVPIKLDISPRLIKTYFDIGPITADELLALRKKILKAQDVESLSYALGYEKREKKQRKSSTRKTKQS